MANRQFSDEELINDLRRVAGLCPKMIQKDYDKHGQYGLSTITYRFGTFKKAVKAAGITFDESPAAKLKQLPDDWSEEFCLDILRKVRWPHGVKCPRCNDGSAIKRLKNQVHSNKALCTYECRDCAYAFTDFTGSFLHQTSTRMRDWLRMILVCSQAADLDLSIAEQARLLGMNAHLYSVKVKIIRSSRLAGELGERLMEELG